MKISIYLASFVLLKAMMPVALYAPPEEGDNNTSVKLKAATFENGGSPLNSSVPSNIPPISTAPPPPPPLPPASFEHAVKGLKALIRDSPEAKKALEAVERSHKVEVAKSRSKPHTKSTSGSKISSAQECPQESRRVTRSNTTAQPANLTLSLKIRSPLTQIGFSVSDAKKAVDSVCKSLEILKQDCERQTVTSDSKDLKTVKEFLEKVTKKAADASKGDEQKEEEFKKVVETVKNVIKESVPVIEQLIEGSEKKPETIKQAGADASVQKVSDFSVVAQDSENEDTVSVQDRISQFSGQQSQQAPVKPKIAQKPDLTARPSAPVVEAKDPEVVKSTENFALEESGEVNDSTTTEAASIVEEPVEELVSDAEEKPKTLAERLADLELNKTTGDKKATVQEQTSTGSVSSLKAKFEQQTSVSPQNT
ncbi:MAG: hypothetical protein V6Z78_02990 [Holosporaceae bacterium]